MITSNSVHKILHTEKTTPPARLIAWGFVLGLLPFVFLSLFGMLFSGMVALFFLPGLVLYGGYWLIAVDGVEASTSKIIWKLAIAYNFIFIVMLFVATDGEGWLLSLFNLGLIGFAYVALRDIKENANKKEELK